MAECCSTLANLRYALSHHTVHMAADIKTGSVLYLGPGHREGTVDQIVTPFSDTDSGSVLVVTVLWAAGGTATVTFVKSDGKVSAKVDETVSAWGVKGHFRNKHKPAPAPRARSDGSTQWLFQ